MSTIHHFNVNSPISFPFSFNLKFTKKKDFIVSLFLVDQEREETDKVWFTQLVSPKEMMWMWLFFFFLKIFSYKNIIKIINLDPQIMKI